MTSAVTPIKRGPQAWKPPKSEDLDPTQRTEEGDLISLQRAWNLPWAEFASCRNHPTYSPDDWFPVSKEPAESEGVRRVCREECAVADLCLAAALRSNHVKGIWGGLDQDERRNVVRRQAVRASRARKNHPDSHSSHNRERSA